MLNCLAENPGSTLLAKWQPNSNDETKALFSKIVFNRNQRTVWSIKVESLSVNSVGSAQQTISMFTQPMMKPNQHLPNETLNR